MKIKTANSVIDDSSQVKAYLGKHGLYAEFWLPEDVDMNVEDPLKRYETQVETLKGKFGYASADCCSLDSSNPQLDEILAPFAKEHHHTDDEVRFTVEGEGIFGVNPKDDSEFEIYVEPGDLLMVPANTRHWFKLTDKKNICCLRIFKENPKWEAVY